MSDYWQHWIIEGDCVEVMNAMQPNGIDSIVCDPPYEIAFMGKDWDSRGVAFDPDTWRAAYRVLKPGGHLLAFGATRTYHRIAVAIEDAGFEIRDSIMWIYGTGFPKSQNVSKAIDKASDDAQEWEGWGTALKPAHEPIIVARKPLSEKTVAANVLKWGTGAINIDATRVSSFDSQSTACEPSIVKEDSPAGMGKGKAMGGNGSNLGRWPANVILDEERAAEMDEQSGITKDGAHGGVEGFRKDYVGDDKPTSFIGKAISYGGSGGASRFFYIAKANTKERNFGLDDKNKHPTVKPLTLMRYLVRLVTPPNGIVLDPFVGSGTTVIAAVQEGFRGLGIEFDSENAELAEKRVEAYLDE